MIGDTHRLLKRFRKAHYVVERGEDSNHHVCWNILHPQGEYTAPRYNRSDAYVGTVQAFNPEPVHVRDDLYLCLGRPTFYMRESLAKSETEKELKRIVQSSPRTKFVPKRI